MRHLPLLLLAACGADLDFTAQEALATLDTPLLVEVPGDDGPGVVAITLAPADASDPMEVLKGAKVAPPCEGCDTTRATVIAHDARVELADGLVTPRGQVALAFTGPEPVLRGVSVRGEPHCVDPARSPWLDPLCDALDDEPGGEPFPSFSVSTWDDHGRGSLRLEVFFGDEGDGGEPVITTTWSATW